jgi:transketolase
MKKSTVNQSDLHRLSKMCLQIRQDILEEVHIAGSGHVGGALSIVEMLVALYFSGLNIRPEEPDWNQRDRFVLSKGHASAALYAVLAERGFFPVKELQTYGTSGSILQKHVDMHRVPGVDVSTGSLGLGLSMAVGMALADQLDGLDRRVFCILGDGETQEGSVWEAAMAASQYRLDHLIVLIDQNGLQVDGTVQDIMNIEPLNKRWLSFGWQVQTINGNDLKTVLRSINRARSTNGKPHLIVARTIKGKGVDFMENQVDWHSHPINSDVLQKALTALGEGDQHGN